MVGRAAVRLWSLHPRYLDGVGLTACWREALLAQKVLAGATRGYRHHPQLERFRAGSALVSGTRVAGALAAGRADTPDRAGSPGDLIVAYLHVLADEADARGYRFDRDRVAGPRPSPPAVAVSDGQLAHEWGLLRAKLAGRSPEVLAGWADVVVPETHPCFVVVKGPVASWEVVRRRR